MILPALGGARPGEVFSQKKPSLKTEVGQGVSEERSGQQNSFERGKSSQPSSMERNILDVIIVSYNVAHLLEDCLGSLLSEKGVDVVITVVDNNSCDGTVAMVREKFPQVNLVASRKNLGFSAANNLALKGSRS
ncbi:rhamnosyltransferase, partial [Candidatus Hakubella thermalkaliphila]